MNIEKERLRKYWRDARFNGDSTFRREASGKIVQHLLNLPDFKRARHIGLYCPLPWEPDLLAIWRKYSDKVFFPKTYPKTLSIKFFPAPSEADFVHHPFGMREPKETEFEKQWSANDIVILPGLAFDHAGSRLGSGKGYYDRFFGSCRDAPQFWGAAFSTRLSLALLPLEAHDLTVSKIITENGVFDT